MGPSSSSRAASNASRLFASRAIAASRAVRPDPSLAARARQGQRRGGGAGGRGGARAAGAVAASRAVSPAPSLAAGARQANRRWGCSRISGASPASSSPSRAACRASASSRVRCRWTGRSSGKSADLLQVDAVLGDDDTQVLGGTAQVATPLAPEDVRVLDVGAQEYAVFVLVEDGRVLGELAAPDGVAPVDRVPGAEALDARRRSVQLLGDPAVPPPVLDPAPDLRRVRL